MLYSAQESRNKRTDKGPAGESDARPFRARARGNPRFKAALGNIYMHLKPSARRERERGGSDEGRTGRASARGHPSKKIIINVVARRGSAPAWSEPIRVLRRVFLESGGEGEKRGREGDACQPR